MDNEQYKTCGDSSCRDCVRDMGRGCEFCNCGEPEEKGACICEGCFKLHVTNWLEDYPDNLPGDILEVRFKNTRRGYYHNANNLLLKQGDIVAVEASPGHDIGIVSLAGDMVARQMKRVGFNPQNGEFKKIYRKAKPYDIEKWQEAIALEHQTMIRSRQIAADMNLNMKIGDVEYQGDKIKAIFYYIADERVDFRELIKVFAEEFHIRVEMKQIGARQEAGRIGGLGSCGRELCCASWISSFISVTTGAARVQDISLNPQKLAGQCSKLKCCLIYEYDDYMDARKEFPKINGPLQTFDADYHFIKNDILARTMSFSTQPGSMAGMVALPIDRVREIIKLNARGIKPETLEPEKAHYKSPAETGFVSGIGEDSITRFDEARRSNKKKKKESGSTRREDDKPREDRNGKKDGDNRNNGGSGSEKENRNNGGRKQDGGKSHARPGIKPRKQSADSTGNRSGGQPDDRQPEKNKQQESVKQQAGIPKREGGQQQAGGPRRDGGQQRKDNRVKGQRGNANDRNHNPGGHGRDKGNAPKIANKK